MGIELAGLVTKKLYQETVYLDPIEIAQDLGRTLKEEEKCDLIICLSHLGYQYQNPQKPDDLKLAARTENIDLIIGGHTHTFLDRPTITNNRKNEQILVNQVGCFGINLGRIDYYFDDAKENVSQGVSIKV